MQARNIYIFLFSIFLTVCVSSHAFSASLSLPDVPQGLSLHLEYVKHEGRVWSVLRLDMADRYYAYAPQDAAGASVNEGQAVQLLVPHGQGSSLPVYLPYGMHREDYYEKGKVIAAFEGEVFLFMPFSSSAQKSLLAEGLQGKLSLLLCSTKHCLPVRIPIHFSSPMPLESLPSLSEKPYFSLWEKTIAQGPVPQKKLENVHKQEKSALEDEIPSLDTMSGTKQGLSAKLSQLQQENSLQGFSVDNTVSVLEWNLTPRAYTQGLEVTSLSKALLLGFLAGLILNLMPCVLPVITLKVQSLMLSEEGESRIKAFRTHNIFFAAGIVTQFLILGVVLGSLGLMWGELFQNIYFVAAMLLIIFTLALSLLGVFTLPMLDIKSAGHGSPRRQAFTTGMVATLLATPCSGPLLGGVLSWAFLQPLYLIVSTIVAVGLGMAFPYIFLAWQPQWGRFLPRPGSWMLVVEKLVAFFLLGTVVYLLAILPSYAHISMLVGLLVLAILGWIWGSFGGLQAPAWRRSFLAMLFMLGATMVLMYGVQEPSRAPEKNLAWHTFNFETFQAELGKKPMLVEFTADWCPNCKYVEKTVLTEENLQVWHERYNLQYVKVDITRDNAAGEAFLHALGSRSIPLTAIFAPGELANSPVILRDIYTKQSLDGALRQALEP